MTTTSTLRNARPSQRTPADHGLHELGRHAFITYVDDLAFSPVLFYLVPNANSLLRGTRVVTQYMAHCRGVRRPSCRVSWQRQMPA